jgi:electron transfer flavoprotein beta subunit
MHIVVCIKQVPDSAQIRVHPVTNTIMRQGVPAIVNPYDLVALEEALRLKDRYKAAVSPCCAWVRRRRRSPCASALSWAPTRPFCSPTAPLPVPTPWRPAMRWPRRFARSAGQPVDLLFAGKQTIDGDTAQVGPGIAKRLGLQLLTYVSKIESLDLERRQISVERRAEGGVQRLQTRCPA